MSLYEKFTYRGRTMDRQTIAAMHAVEKRLGYAKDLLQGSYNASVSQSAGTHDGGGAVDLIWFDINRLNRAMRDDGCFAGWPRETLPGEWSRHYHGILIGNDKASDSAKRQVDSYRAGRNGLADNDRDDWPYRPDPIRKFDYHRAGLVSWKRLNAISRHPKGIAFTTSGAQEVEVVARALEGFNMDLTFDGRRHVKGRMDKPLLEALERFKRARKVRAHVDAPLNPKTAYELCVPIREDS